MQTWDSDFIKRVMTNRRIWPHISDDFAPPPDQFEPVMAPGIYYLAPEHDGQRVGVFMYMPHSTILFEVHTCILPLYRGGPAIKAARNSLAWSSPGRAIPIMSCRPIRLFVLANGDSVSIAWP